jgi:hypothetical protein
VTPLLQLSLILIGIDFGVFEAFVECFLYGFQFIKTWLNFFHIQFQCFNYAVDRLFTLFGITSSGGTYSLGRTVIVQTRLEVVDSI